MQEQKEATIDLRGILTLFRKRIGLIVLCTLLAVAVGSVYTFFIATPVYTASTQLVVKLPDSENSAAYTGQVTGNIQMTNTINQVIVSPAILNQVKNKLNLNESLQGSVTSMNATNSQVINITVKNANPYTAKSIADTTAQIFSQNASKILNITNVSILSEATADTTPISPKPKLYIAISVVIGLIIGAGIALLIEAFNNKITNEKDIEAVGLTFLGATSFATEKDFRKSVSSAHETATNEPTTRSRRANQG